MKYLLATLFIVLATACQPQKITISQAASETFYVDNEGASMRVLVEGNTASKVLLLFIHGGPGDGAYGYRTDYIRHNIEDKYACVYWDQRNAGASQGNSNGDKLTLSQLTEDLKKVIQTLTFRYGRDVSIILLGHSFGGLLAASFMTTADYQFMVKGWIVMDGAHNYPLNDSLSRQMLLTQGKQQLALNKHTEKWTPIVAYCEAHAPPLTFDESNQLNSYAHEAETYFDAVKPYDLAAEILKHSVSNDTPISASFVNSLYSVNAPFNRALAQTSFSSSLVKVVRPTLLLYGQYDFICPRGSGEDIVNRINTKAKRLVISPISGHSFYVQDEVLFCSEVNNFISQYK